MVREGDLNYALVVNQANSVSNGVKVDTNGNSGAGADLGDCIHLPVLPVLPLKAAFPLR